MSLFNELSQNLRKSSQRWITWARQHAQELGESSLRQIERQDLLTELHRLQTDVGRNVVEAFLDKKQKTIRPGSTQIADQLKRIEAINTRLDEIAAEEEQQRAEEQRTDAAGSDAAGTEGSNHSDSLPRRALPDSGVQENDTPADEAVREPGEPSGEHKEGETHPNN